MISLSLFPRSLGALLLAAFASSALAQTTFTHDLAGNRASQTAAVPGPPTVALPPANQLGQIGGTARFGVAAGGPGPFTYQWYKDTSPITGATADTLVLFSLTAGDFAPNPTGTPKYSVRVTNASGSVTSTSVAVYLDTNGSGLADWWQLQYFGALGVDPNADADGDGISNLQEYRDGTAPTTGTSRLGRLALSGARGLTAVSSPADTFAGGATATAVAVPYGELQFGGWTGTYRSLSDTFTFGFPSGGSFVGDVVLIGLFGSLPPQETNSSPAFTYADGTPAQITGFAVAPDGSTVVFGAFDRVNGVARTLVARLRADGSLDPNFAPAPDDLVTAAVVQPDGKVVLAGNFASVNGQPRPGVARLLASGALDTGFIPADQGANRSQAAALAVQRDGKVLYGGTLWVGANPLYLARLNTDGSPDAAFNPTLDGPLTALAVQPDTKILIGGNFKTVNGVDGYKIRRLDAAGARDPAFAVTEYGTQEYGGPTYTAPGVIIVQPDGRILLGGPLLIYVGGRGSRHIPVSRLKADGTRDEAFNESVANSLDTLASSGLALQSDGRIVGVGTFSLANPSLVNAFRLNANGTLDPTGFAVSHPDAPFNAVAVASDDSVLFGGAFTQLSPGTPLQNGHAYFLTSSPLAWSQTEAQANSLGGHLVAVNSQAEQDFLFSTFVPAAAPLRVSDDPLLHQYWNGFNDYATPGTFNWTTGEPVTYTNWFQGSHGSYHVAVMNRSYILYDGQDLPGVWSDIPDAGATGFSQAALDGPCYGIIEVDQNAPVTPVINPSVNWIAGRDLRANELTTAETVNPNATVPTWSYGYRATAAATALTLYTAAQHSNTVSGNESLQGWVDDTNFVAVNSTAGVTSGPVGPGEMLLNPRGDGQSTVVRWTAPAPAAYSVTAFWQDTQTGGQGPTVSLVVNGQSLYHYSIPNAGSGFTTQVVTLAAGGTVDFVLDADPMGASGQATRFNAIVRQAASVQARTWVGGRDLMANELPDGGANERTDPNATVSEWSYGRRATPVASALTLFAAGEHSNAMGGTTTIQGWSRPDAGVGVNVGASPVYDAGLPNAPGEMFIYPGSDGTVPVARWTAPRAGAYDVLAFWQDGDYGGGDGFTANIVVNGAQVFGRTLDNTAGCSAAQTLVLKAGDTVDFTMGIRGEYSYDVTRFNCAILDGDRAPGSTTATAPAVYGDSFTHPRAGFARMVATNHLIPGTLGVSPAGPVFGIRPAATFTLTPQLSSANAAPVYAATLEASSDGVNFAAAATGAVDFSSGACTFTVPALPAGTTYYRAQIVNTSSETARSYPVGPLVTPPAVTSALNVAGIMGQPFVYRGTATGPLAGFTASNLPAWATASYDPNTGMLTIAGTPNVGGTSLISLRPANIAGTTSTRLTVSVPNTFSAWRTANFTASELQNPAVSGPNADPTGSGIPNLLRYALGIPAKGDGTARLPTVSMQNVGGANYLTLTYTRDKSAADVVFAVQVSGDLTNPGGWNSGTGYTTETRRTDNGDGTETVVTRDHVAQTSAGRRFMRLQVSQQ